MERHTINSHPLYGLVGRWHSINGLDISPSPQKENKETPYTETIQFQYIGEIKNYNKQNLETIAYCQLIKSISDQSVLHHQMGYWMWDKDNKTVMYSLTIPRGVNVLAGGYYNRSNTTDTSILLQVTASMSHPNWQISQSPLMKNNATTIAFNYAIEVYDDRFIYEQTIQLEIYGQHSSHVDKNILYRHIGV